MERETKRSNASFYKCSGKQIEQNKKHSLFYLTQKHNSKHFVQIKNMYPILDLVSKKLTSYLHTLINNKPDGIDLKDVSYLIYFIFLSLTF